MNADHDYQLGRNKISQLNKIEGVVSGLKVGLTSLGYGVKSGLVGVVERPISGAKNQGPLGALKGSVEGLMGLLTKSTTGLLDAASKTIEGIKYSSSILNKECQS